MVPQDESHSPSLIDRDNKEDVKTGPTFTSRSCNLGIHGIDRPVLIESVESNSSTPAGSTTAMLATSSTSPSPPIPLNNKPTTSNTNNIGDDFRRLSIYEMILTNHRNSADPNQPVSFSKNERYYSYENALHRPVPIENSSSNGKGIASSSNSRGRNQANSTGAVTYDNFSLGYLTRRSLPIPQPWYPTAGPSEVPPDFSWISNSCGGKAAIGVFGGGLMGLLMGVFLGAMSDATPPVQVIGGKDVPQAPFKEQLRTTLRATADKSLYWCRNFAFITGVFTGSECLVEKYRGTHDVWNSVVGGCITGATLQAKSGPQSAAIGCGGFAAFSLVIDSVMGTH